MKTMVARRKATPRGIGGLFSRLLRSVAGASAVEFALLSPVLVLGTLGTVDAGRALYQKMMINQALRSGAQAAFMGKEEAIVRDVLVQTASDNFAVTTGSASGDQLAVSVTSYCACPGTVIVQIGCLAICTGSLTPVPFYRLTATKNFEGILLPAFTLSGAIDAIRG